MPKASTVVQNLFNSSLETPNDVEGEFMGEEEEEKAVFTVNTVYSRCERNPVKEVCESLDWAEGRSETKGSLFWFIDACSGAQRKMMKESNAYFNRYPRFSII